jgi:hypothetical protein
LLALERSRVEVESRRKFAVRAPIAGRVMAVQQKVGAPAAPAQVVLTIVPDHSPLVGRLLIPTRAIGFVRPGQRIALRFDAFPTFRDASRRSKTSRRAYCSTAMLGLPRESPASRNRRDRNRYCRWADVPLQSGMLRKPTSSSNVARSRISMQPPHAGGRN